MQRVLGSAKTKNGLFLLHAMNNADSRKEKYVAHTLKYEFVTCEKRIESLKCDTSKK